MYDSLNVLKDHGMRGMWMESKMLQVACDFLTTDSYVDKDALSSHLQANGIDIDVPTLNGGVLRAMQDTGTSLDTSLEVLCGFMDDNNLSSQLGYVCENWLDRAGGY